MRTGTTDQLIYWAAEGMVQNKRVMLVCHSMSRGAYIMEKIGIHLLNLGFSGVWRDREFRVRLNYGEVFVVAAEHQIRGHSVDEVLYEWSITPELRDSARYAEKLPPPPSRLQRIWKWLRDLIPPFPAKNELTLWRTGQSAEERQKAAHDAEDHRRRMDKEAKARVK